MKSLFSDNRLANLLHLFHNTQTMSVNNMAAKLKVSDRTIRNDIKELNQTLNGCALIEGFQGRYTLRVFDAEMFKNILSELSEADEFLNSPRNRMDYMFGKLMRAEMPLLIDDLAYEMSIGRTKPSPVISRSFAQNWRNTAYRFPARPARASRSTAMNSTSAATFWRIITTRFTAPSPLIRRLTI